MPAVKDSGSRFTDRLRDGAAPYWLRATTHRFTRELASGTLDDAAFRRYLIQDYAFVDALAGLVGFAVGRSPGMARKARYAGFLSVLTNEEDTFFQRSFEALGVSRMAWEGAARAPATRALESLFVEARQSGGYEEILAVLLPVEWVYLTWATDRAAARPARFYHAEWLTLHNDPGFRDFVDWMRDDMDRCGSVLPPDRQGRVATLFRRACELEVRFFAAAYDENG